MRKEVITVKWEDDRRSELGFKIDGNEFEYQILKGRSPYLDELLSIVKKYFFNELKEAQTYKRKNPWKISAVEGMSGCIRYYLDHIIPVGSFYAKKRKKIFKLSSYNKMSEGFVCFLPDMAELLMNDMNLLERGLPELKSEPALKLFILDKNNLEFNGFQIPE